MEAAAKAASGAQNGTFVPLRLLSKNSMEEIAQSLLNSTLSDFFKELILYCGGNPRYEEYVFVALSTFEIRDPFLIDDYYNLKKVDLELLSKANNQKIHTEMRTHILTNLMNQILKRTEIGKYINMNLKDIQYLLAYELLNKPVKRTYQLGKQSIEELESQGLIFLSPSKYMKLQSFFTVSIPYITFYYLFQQQQAPVPKLLRTEVILESRSNEISDVSIIMMKLGLLRDVLGQNTFQFKEIFPCHSRFKDMEFYIPKGLQLKEIREDISGYTNSKFDNQLLSMIEQNYCAGMGSPSSSFPDAWIVVKSVANNLNYILYIQSKRRRDIGFKATPGKYVTGSIEVEHTKCKFYPDHHYFIFITDDNKRKREDFKYNEIVITSDVHTEFYGKCLALRKLNMI